MSGKKQQSLFTDPISSVDHPLSSSQISNKIAPKEDYYNEFKSIGKEMESPILSIVKNKIPDAELSSPKPWKREPTSKCFITINDDIKYTNEYMTGVVTKSKNDILMLVHPICSIHKNIIHHAVIGYYNDIVLEQDNTIRKIIFVHDDHQYIITKSIEEITGACTHVYTGDETDVEIPLSKEYTTPEKKSSGICQIV